MSDLWHEQDTVTLFCCSVCNKKKPAEHFHRYVNWLQARWIVCQVCAAAGKHCSICEKYQSFDKFPKGQGTNRGGVRGYCKPCDRAYRRERYKLKGKTEAELRRGLVARYKQYNLTPADYQLMYDAQGGLCASCGLPPGERSGKVLRLSVDHNHTTGEVRELLCGPCNVALGNLRDDPERIRKLLVYAEKWQQPEENLS